MKLSRKVFLYTFATTMLIGLLIISYFSILLPGLFEEYKIDQYFRHVQGAQEQIMFQEQCQPSSTIDAITTISLEIPASGYELRVCNNYFSANATVEDAQLQDFLDQVRNQTQKIEDATSYENVFNQIDFTGFENFFEQTDFGQFIQFSNFENHASFISDDQAVQDFRVYENFFIASAQVHNDANTYLTFIAFGEQENHLYISIGSAMAPRLDELSAIISASLPMIFAVLLFVSMLFARFFTKQLAAPVEALAKQANQWQLSKHFVFKQPNKNDEYKALENALNQMQQEIIEANLQLQVSNQQLSQAKTRQEDFMMNASHHLKTPLASATLLVDSMIMKVGKFEDTETYLPKVKASLDRMRELLSSMLNAFRQNQSTIQKTTFDMKDLMENILSRYETDFQQHQLHLTTEFISVHVHSDSELMTSIVDNFISNAIKYTESNQSIKITLTPTTLVIYNQHDYIPDSILQEMKQPFVRSAQHQASGNGLGLYLAHVFSSLLNCEWTIENAEEGIRITLNLKEII